MTGSSRALARLTIPIGDAQAGEHRERRGRARLGAAAARDVAVRAAARAEAAAVLATERLDGNGQGQDLSDEAVQMDLGAAEPARFELVGEVEPFVGERSGPFRIGRHAIPRRLEHESEPFADRRTIASEAPAARE